MIKMMFGGRSAALSVDGAVLHAVMTRAQASRESSRMKSEEGVTRAPKVGDAHINRNVPSASLYGREVYSIADVFIPLPKRTFKASLSLRMPFSSPSFGMQTEEGHVEVITASDTFLSGTFDVTLEEQNTAVRIAGQVAGGFGFTD